jgi:hypothetical protein
MLGRVELGLGDVEKEKEEEEGGGSTQRKRRRTNKKQPSKSKKAPSINHHAVAQAKKRSDRPSIPSRYDKTSGIKSSGKHNTFRNSTFTFTQFEIDLSNFINRSIVPSSREPGDQSSIILQYGHPICPVYSL